MRKFSATFIPPLELVGSFTGGKTDQGRWECALKSIDGSETDGTLYIYESEIVDLRCAECETQIKTLVGPCAVCGNFLTAEPTHRYDSL